MCGIAGFIGENITENFINETINDLRHRGQSGFGVFGYNLQGILYQIKKTNFSQRSEIPKNSGSVIIGTRYPTSGGDIDKDNPTEYLAPYTFSNNNGTVSVVYNGNIPYKDLQGFKNDTALFTQKLASLLQKNSIEDSIKILLKETPAAYSVIASINENKIIAFRDQFGIRPLSFGKNEEGFMISSETQLIQKLGYELIGEVPAGAVIEFNKKEYKITQLLPKKIKKCMFEFVYYSQPENIISNISVGTARKNIGRELAKLFDKEIDLITFIPNSSIPTAIGYGEQKNIPIIPVLAKKNEKRNFIEVEKGREYSVKHKYQVYSEFIQGKKLGVIDDSIIRGRTSKHIVDLLKQNGASEVHLLIGCPPVISPCYYGVDIRTREELIAHRNDSDTKRIAQEVGADSVTYLNIEALKKILGQDICTGCLTGQYPTKTKF